VFVADGPVLAIVVVDVFGVQVMLTCAMGVDGLCWVVFDGVLVEWVGVLFEAVGIVMAFHLKMK
jgi:hypothetical protein